MSDPIEPLLTGLAHAALAESVRNPRKAMDDDALAELAASIEANGVLQNLVVGLPGKKGVHPIVAGARRWRAVGLLIRDGRSIAGAPAADYRLPCRVTDLEPAEALAMALAENMQRADLTPMEEADAFAQLRDDHGWSTEKTAGLVHKTTRFVQRRLALTDKLDPAAQKALRDGAINFMQAEALTVASSKKEQKGALQNIKQGWGGWSTAAEIRRTLLRDKHAVGKNHFPLEQYDGEYVLGEDGAPTHFADSAQFERLQRAAAAAEVEVLAAVWSWAELRDDRAENGYFTAYAYATTKSKRTGGAVVALRSNLTVEIFEGLRKPTPAKAKAKADAEPAKPVRHFTDTHLRLAKRLKTHALQDAVAGKPGAALRLCVLGLLGAREVRVEYAGGDSNGNAGYGAEAVAASRKACLALGGDPDMVVPGMPPLAYPVFAHHRERFDPVATWVKLNELSDAEVLQILAAIVACQTGTWNDYQAALGDSALAARIAQDLDVDMRPVAQAQLHDDVYLASAGKRHLLEIARDLGHTPKDSATAKTLRALIGESLIPSMSDYVPRELRWGDAALTPADQADRDAQAAEDAEDECLDEEEDFGDDALDEEAAA